eukprot:PhF_6_TR19112/c0_g1_i1/m.28118
MYHKRIVSTPNLCSRYYTPLGTLNDENFVGMMRSLEKSPDAPTPNDVFECESIFLKLKRLPKKSNSSKDRCKSVNPRASYGSTDGGRITSMSAEEYSDALATLQKPFIGFNPGRGQRSLHDPRIFAAGVLPQLRCKSVPLANPPKYPYLAVVS